MLLDFFIEHALVELDDLGLTYIGTVPDLPDIRVEAPTPDECRAKLTQAISRLLAAMEKTVRSKVALMPDSVLPQARLSQEARPLD